MDLKTLQTFQSIVKHGSFHRAAEELNYAQSTVTMQIQKLESVLGTQLFERGKTIRLTEAGRLFHEQSARIVKDLERLQSSVSDMRLGEVGHVRLGVTEPTASRRLPRMLERFLSRYPKVRVSVDIGGTPALIERLNRGELDLAVCSAPGLGLGFGTDLAFEPLFTEEFVVLMPAGHPLSDKKVVAAEDLRDYRLLITAANCPYRHKLDMLLRESGGPPPDTMEIGSMSALKYYVECGLGIALVPMTVLQPAPAGTVARPMSVGSAVGMTGGIVCKASEFPLTPAGAKLYHFLKRELAEAGAGTGDSTPAEYAL